MSAVMQAAPQTMQDHQGQGTHRSHRHRHRSRQTDRRRNAEEAVRRCGRKRRAGDPRPSASHAGAGAGRRRIVRRADGRPEPPLPGRRLSADQRARQLPQGQPGQSGQGRQERHLAHGPHQSGTAAEIHHAVCDGGAGQGRCDFGVQLARRVRSAARRSAAKNHRHENGEHADQQRALQDRQSRHPQRSAGIEEAADGASAGAHASRYRHQGRVVPQEQDRDGSSA